MLVEVRRRCGSRLRVWASPWLFLLLVLVLQGSAQQVQGIDLSRFHTLIQERYGSERLPDSWAWEQLLIGLQGAPELQQLEQVNAFFLRTIEYRTDMELYGVEDHWATPLETLGHGQGDCEDYAIAKYASLRMLGVSDERLRLIYVFARLGEGDAQVTEPHMVLGYYATPTSQPLILDSLNPEILPAAQRPDLRPVFSFNAEGMWTGGATAPSGNSTARLSRWRDVLDRMPQEGVRW